ncbi:MAG TPA: COQ9 family protein [Rhizorhapis sp.]|nr:COQ9 family protein [Rhizorhapis sp.]
MTGLPVDPTLDEVREYLAPLLPGQAAFDGWNRAALRNAAAEAGLDAAMVELAFPGGAMDMIDAWFAWIDREMEGKYPPETLAPMKVRERITALIEARLMLLAPEREALRRAQAIMALPQNLVAATQLGWRAADQMWRLAGDVATDFNHYSKRATLAAVYAATLLIFLGDESEGWIETRGFLSRRIDGIIRFERTKQQWRANSERRPSLARFIGRLRYPAI